MLIGFQGGGNVKIESRKIDIKAAPRIEAKNSAYVSRGGDKKVRPWNLIDPKWTIQSIVNVHVKHELRISRQITNLRWATTKKAGRENFDYLDKWSSRNWLLIVLDRQPETLVECNVKDRIIGQCKSQAR